MLLSLPVVGVIGIAVSAIFYYYIENVLEKKYNNTKLAKALAWSHIVLMNVGTTAATGMLMYAGYVSGTANVTVRCRWQRV